MRSITVPATEDATERITDFVNEELSQYDCPPKALFQIEVAIEEISVNIVSYAGLAEDADIEIRCDVLDDPLRVVVQFLDDGVPFDPLEKEDPDTSPEAIEQRIGGLGIFMVKQMMDSVSYAYENGKNTLTILKHLT